VTNITFTWGTHMTTITLILALVVLAVVILSLLTTSEVTDEMYRGRGRDASRDRANQ
jgi:heme/copper-type cytochrome/quinol oxidase subunit 1